MDFLKKISSAVKSVFAGVVYGVTESVKDVASMAKKHPFIALTAIGGLSAAALSGNASMAMEASNIAKFFVYPVVTAVELGGAAIFAKNAIKGGVKAYGKFEEAREVYEDAVDAYEDGQELDGYADRIVAATDRNYRPIEDSFFSILGRLISSEARQAHAEETALEYDDSGLEEDELDGLLADQGRSVVSYLFGNTGALSQEGFEEGEELQADYQMPEAYDQLPQGNGRYNFRNRH